MLGAARDVEIHIELAAVLRTNRIKNISGRITIHIKTYYNTPRVGARTM